MDLVETAVKTLGIALPVVSAILFVGMWSVATTRHRSHLAQCDAWRVRMHRLNRRLRACVTDIETYLQAGHPMVPEMIPEPMVGHVRYLRGIRQECRDLASELGRHAIRLRWPDGYLSRVTLAGRRCESAHAGLRAAADALALAAREYERMFGVVLGRPAVNSVGTTTLGLAEPLLLLDEAAASELTALRESFAEGVRAVSDVLSPGDRRNITIDGIWPVYRSELDPETDHYQGDVRPMAWTGFGDQPLTHVDAR